MHKHFTKMRLPTVMLNEILRKKLKTVPRYSSSVSCGIPYNVHFRTEICDLRCWIDYRKNNVDVFLLSRRDLPWTNKLLNSATVWGSSGKNTRLPPMWPGFDFRTRRHMWVEFVVGARPCSEGFTPGSPVFRPPQKPTFPNFDSTR